MSKIPMEPGYYWAKWRIAADGTHEGDELTPSDTWEIVQVNSNNVDDPNDDEYLSVSVPGVRETQWRDGFVWGKFVAPIQKRSPPPAMSELEIAAMCGGKNAAALLKKPRSCVVNGEERKMHGRLRKPNDTPLNEWSDGWLVMEVASLLDTPGYIIMTDAEREREGYPASRDQRADFIASRREADALLADPQ